MSNEQEAGWFNSHTEDFKKFKRIYSVDRQLTKRRSDGDNRSPTRQAKKSLQICGRKYISRGRPKSSSESPVCRFTNSLPQPRERYLSSDPRVENTSTLSRILCTSQCGLAVPRFTPLVLYAAADPIVFIWKRFKRE
jgi:hypothetical protein